MEAVIAAVIILGAIIFLLPKTGIDQGEMPYELEVSAQAILDAAQQNPDFRRAVLIDGEEETLNNKIKESLPKFSPWDYAFSICDGNDPDAVLCENFIIEEDNVEAMGDFNEFSNQLPKNIYTKSLFLSYDDVTSPTHEDNVGEQKIIRLYFWEK